MLNERHQKLVFCNFRFPIPSQAKIADFSLLKQLESDSNEAQTRIAGTPGYVDPSYRRTGTLRPRSDVYW